MKKTLCVMSDSPLLNEVVECVISSSAVLAGSDISDFERIATLPKKWGGCIIPLRLASLDKEVLYKCEGKIRSAATESCIRNISYCLCRDTRKKDRAKVGIGLVKKGRKFTKTGVLIFWER